MKIGILIILGALVLITSPWWGGELKILYNKTTGTRSDVSMADRKDEAFRNSKSYQLSKLRTLGQYQNQYYKSTDPAEKEAILDQVRRELYDIDSTQINNSNLKAFYDKAFNNNIF